MNIKSTIVPLTWPENLDPLHVTRFETEARRLRYQALGLTCRDQKINSLLVAHHGDDQAETVMMRLFKNRWRSGLQGMQSVEWIPECYGLYGVYHSGGAQSRAAQEQGANRIPLKIEEGGIQVLRPMLGFEKSRLIATCKKHGTAWAEDKTNHIRTYTSRNAIRYVLQNHTLPEALSKQSLITLAQRMQTRVESHRELANNIFNTCFLSLDIQTGSLVVRFPPASSFLDRPIVTDFDKNEARNTAYLFLQRIAELVSPRESPSVGQFANAVDSIWPRLSVDSTPTLNATFCVFGIWFRPWGNPTPFRSEEGIPVVHEMDYLLTRQPLDHFEKNNADIFLTIPPVSENPAMAEKWHLFDGRFWIRLKNPTDEDLHVRVLTNDELIQLAANPRQGLYLQAALNLIKPADLRQTIPAVFHRDNNGQETLLCLPTLRVALRNSSILDSCEVRYKKVDFGKRSAEEIVVPGLSRVDISGEIIRLKGESNRKSKTTEDSLEQHEHGHGERLEMLQQRITTMWSKAFTNKKRAQGDEKMQKETDDEQRVTSKGYKRINLKPEFGAMNFRPVKRLNLGSRSRTTVGSHRLQSETPERTTKGF